MSDDPLPLPSLTLPVALLRFWPEESDDRRARATATELFGLPGVVRLEERIFAILPVDGRGSVFEDAVSLSTAFFDRLESQNAGDEVSSILIFPAEVIQHGEAIVLVRDPLMEDLDRRRPRLPRREVVLTGYAARWLDGRYEMKQLDPYSGPSGRRIPFFCLLGPKARSVPWHNPQVLGHRIRVPRPEIAAALRCADPQAAVWVQGSLGAGKSHAVWHALEERKGPKIWIGIGRALSGGGILGSRLASELRRLAPDAIPVGAAELLHGAPPDQAAEALLEWLAATVKGLDDPPTIVCDLVQTASEDDLELLGHLAAGPLQCGLFLISRGDPESNVDSLPRIEIPAMDDAEARRHARELTEGLSLDPDIEARWVSAAAGIPFALEEGLLGLVHRGFIRQVYGSFFYDGGDDVEYKPSQRLVRHVEAEVRRLGEPLPLRILSLAAQVITPGHLELTCARFGVQMAEDWSELALASGLLRKAESPWGSGLTFRCPAYARALAGTVTFEAASSLRRALGRVITKEPESPEKGWATYRLLAGTPEALLPLLDLSRDSGDQATRDELFEALESEYRQHQRRGGDAAAELEILWSMLPLARHLGRLGELEPELRRAISLAVDHKKRHIALLTLQAEHDQEKGRFSDAESSLRQALGATSGAGGDHQRAVLFIRLGDLLKSMDRLTESREVFESLLEVVDRQDRTSVGATCHFHLGNIALREMRLEDAMLHHKKAERVRREKELFKPLGTSLTALGAVGMAVGDYSKALGYYREALEVIAEYGDDTEESGFAHLGSGRAQRSLGNHAEAAKLLQRALEARRGRDDVVGEAIARLDLAANQLELGNTEKALREARQAHFQLSLLPATSLLGDAEQLLGRILLHQRQDIEANVQLAEALRIHRQHDDRTAAAIDSAWLLELALRRDDQEAIVNYSSALEKLLKKLPYPPAGEMLNFRLYRAFDWFKRHKVEIETPDPLTYLRRAYRELMRKTGYLAPELRHGFLYQIQEHQDVINAAAENNLSHPGI